MNRSLYNDATNSSSVQTRAILQNVYSALRSADTKVLKNILLSDSSIDNTPIGNSIPSTGHFTSLLVGFPSLGSLVSFYGPNKSSLMWKESNLTLTSSTLQLDSTNIKSSSDLSIQSNKSIEIMTGSGESIKLNSDLINLLSSKFQWNNLAYIQPTSGNNSIQISDPIPQLGDSSLASSSDSGILFTNYFLGQTSSRRLSQFTDKSLQFLNNPAIQIKNNSKHVSNNSASNHTFVELDTVSINRLLYPFEKIVVDNNTMSTPILSPNIYISKIYCSTQTQINVYLPDGDDDGTVKCIQFLPLKLNDSTLVQSPSLSIWGKFCLPTYLKQESNDMKTLYTALTQIQNEAIVLPTVGCSIMLNYDTTISSWCLMSTGCQ